MAPILGWQGLDMLLPESCTAVAQKVHGITWMTCCCFCFCFWAVRKIEMTCSPRSPAQWAAARTFSPAYGVYTPHGTQHDSGLGRQVSGLHVPVCVCVHTRTHTGRATGKAPIQEEGDRAPIWTHH